MTLEMDFTFSQKLYYTGYKTHHVIKKEYEIEGLKNLSISIIQDIIINKII